MIVTVIQMVVAINMGNTYFNQCLNYAYTMPGTSLKAPCMLSDLILKTTLLCSGYYYYCCLTEKKDEAQKI